MSKILPTLTILLTLTPCLAMAAASARTDFRTVRCEDNVEVIRKSLSQMTTGPGGHRFSEILGNNSKMTATTVGSTEDRLTCKVSVNVFSGGASQDVRGRYSMHSLRDGRIEQSFTPFY